MIAVSIHQTVARVTYRAKRPPSAGSIAWLALSAETATPAGSGTAVSLGITSRGTTLGPTWVGARATLDWFVAELGSDDVGVRYAAPFRRCEAELRDASCPRGGRHAMSTVRPCPD